MPLKVIDLGLVDFKEAWVKQKELFAEVKNGALRAGLILCRHHPVITVGKGGSKKNILASEQELKKRGISVYEIERGGDVTYHGPGQLIAYPVFDLSYFKKDIHWFLRHLEGLIIRSLEGAGVKGERIEGLTGVWVRQSKIASIGISVRNWITSHGLSINVKNSDLSSFSLIRPCGMDIMVTSVESEIKKTFCIEEFKGKLITVFQSASALN